MDLAGQRPRWPIADPEAFRIELKHWIRENWDLEVTVAESSYLSYDTNFA